VGNEGETFLAIRADWQGVDFSAIASEDKKGKKKCTGYRNLSQCIELKKY